MKPDHDYDHDNRADFEEEPFYPEPEGQDWHYWLLVGFIAWLLFVHSCAIGFFVLLTRW